MTTPTWLAAAGGQPGQASQINQFLTVHPSQLLYGGSQIAAQATDGNAATNSNGLYVAQKFTMSGTAIGRLVLTLAKVGSPAPLHVSLRADNAGAPGAAEIVGVNLPGEFVGSKAAVYLPLPASGLTSAGTYWVVLSAVGDASDYYAVERSNQASGASTSPDGTTWTAQAYGFLYQVWDQSVSGNVVHEWVDSGARWSLLTYTSTGLPQGISEYVAGQNGTHQAAARTLTYTNGQLSQVT